MHIMNVRDHMIEISGVRLDKPVEFAPYVARDCYSEPLDNAQFFIMDADSVKPFIDELVELDAIYLIKETLQSLCERKDGTLLKTAFPDLVAFMKIGEKMKTIPKELIEALSKWESLGANELDISFEQDMRSNDSLRNHY